MHIFHRFSKELGAILLVTGCCIGAGMLGLPLVSLESGFLPSLAMFFISWAFMAATGLLVLEVNVRCGEGTNLMSMAEQVLGKPAKYGVAILFAFLFYCLILAYICGTGALMEEIFFIPRVLGSILAIVLFGAVIYQGTKQVDVLNRIFILGLGGGYLFLIALGLPAISNRHLSHVDWKFALPILPSMIISFGYHNLIPSLNSYLRGNIKSLKIAILLGSFIPLLVYLIWELVFLGTVPFNSDNVQAIKMGCMVTDLFQNGGDSQFALYAMRVFSFFAIVTSLLTVAMSFVDFLIDGMRLKPAHSSRAVGCLFVLLPPLFFSFLYPKIFLTALNYAGAFGAVILFGMLPVMMVWKGRYYDRSHEQEQLPGGKSMLIVLGLFALFIFAMQLKIEWGA
ncbi:MAG: amino acid permease [Parachlamydiaceae bacterium]